MSEEVIKIKNLTKRFSEIKAVAGIDLVVKKGEMFGLVGPDGAGKTTVIKMLCGIIEADAGTGSMLGYDFKNEKDKIKLQIGYLSQKFSLYQDLSIDENIEFFAEIHGVKDYEEKRNELLRFTRLTEFRSRLAGKLSGGMKQKLALACTLIHRPELLLLDEPTTGVDPVSRREFWRILYSLLGRGVTILVSTPYMDEAERCNTVSFMSAGRIAVSEAPNDLKRLVGREILELRAEPRRAAMLAARQVQELEDVRVFGDLLHLVTVDALRAEQAMRAAFEGNGIRIVSLRRIEPSMEDAFMSLTGESSVTSHQLSASEAPGRGQG